jgi:hypothetical protein
MLQESGLALAETLAYSSKDKTFAAWRTLEPSANLGEAKAELGHRAAQGVAMDAKFLGGLTLIASVSYQHFAQILPLELANSIVIADAAGMHLRDQAIQFSSHVHPLLF